MVVKGAGAPQGRTWARSVLAGLGIQPNPTNTAALRMWAASEGNSKGRGYNWLNSVQPMPGSSALAGNSAGVQNYATYTEGVAATVKTLRGGTWRNVTRALATPSGARPNTTTAKRKTPINRYALTRIWTAIHSASKSWTKTQPAYPAVMWTFLNGKGATSGGVIATGTTAGGAQSTCVWHIGVGPISGCVLNENQARALKGGLLLVGGAFVMLVGVGILASFGFGSRAAQSQLRKVGIGGSGGGGQPAPAPRTEEAPAPMTQADRNRQRVESLPPEVREEARRRREAYGLTGSSTRSAAGATPTTPRPAPAERRPRAQPPTGTVTSSGHPSRRAKRPHGRTTGLGPKARARRGR